jgi:type I restriction enzyme S subunit
MALIEYTFGDLIELYIVQNSDGKYGADSAIGINIDKEIRVMRGDSSRKELEKFYIVPPGAFVYNPRGSRKLGLGYNDTSNTYITTFNNMIFKIRDCANDIILPRYLFMYLARKEWDRKAEFLSWGSSTEVFSWDIFCETSITLPPLLVQQEYVDVYNSMLANQRVYERGLEDLRIVLEGYTDNLRHQCQLEPLGKYLELVETRNESLQYGIDDVKGVSIEKIFIDTKADMTGVNLKPYFVVRPNEFAYVTVTSRNGEKISLAINDSKDTYICSSSYVVFRSKDVETLLPQYLMLYFSRSEFNRHARFHSWGSARETFDWDEMCAMEIPVPEIKIQQYIVNIYIAYQLRKEINEQLKAQIRDICPILIKGSFEEARG